jgi:hypothetical protein
MAPKGAKDSNGTSPKKGQRGVWRRPMKRKKKGSPRRCASPRTSVCAVTVNPSGYYREGREGGQRCARLNTAASARCNTMVNSHFKQPQFTVRLLDDDNAPGTPISPFRQMGISRILWLGRLRFNRFCTMQYDYYMLNIT